MVKTAMIKRPRKNTKKMRGGLTPAQKQDLNLAIRIALAGTTSATVLNAIFPNLTPNICIIIGGLGEVFRGIFGIASEGIYTIFTTGGRGLNFASNILYSICVLLSDLSGVNIQINTTLGSAALATAGVTAGFAKIYQNKDMIDQKLAQAGQNINAFWKMVEETDKKKFVTDAFVSLFELLVEVLSVGIEQTVDQATMNTVNLLNLLAAGINIDYSEIVQKVIDMCKGSEPLSDSDDEDEDDDDDEDAGAVCPPNAPTIEDALDGLNQASISGEKSSELSQILYNLALQKVKRETYPAKLMEIIAGHPDLLDKYFKTINDNPTRNAFSQPEGSLYDPNSSLDISLPSVTGKRQRSNSMGGRLRRSKKRNSNKSRNSIKSKKSKKSKKSRNSIKSKKSRKIKRMRR
jgi:hypothetical protein